MSLWWLHHSNRVTFTRCNIMLIWSWTKNALLGSCSRLTSLCVMIWMRMGCVFFVFFDSQVWEKVTRIALADIGSISTAFQKLMRGLQRDGAAFHSWNTWKKGRWCLKKEAYSTVYISFVHWKIFGLFWLICSSKSKSPLLKGKVNQYWFKLPYVKFSTSCNFIYER